MNDQTNAQTETTQAPADKLTQRYNALVERIRIDTAKAQELYQEIQMRDQLANIGIGSQVVVKLGRKFADKDTTRFENGTVLGVRVKEDGSKEFKVQYGVGFDADTCIVGANAIQLPA